MLSKAKFVAAVTEISMVDNKSVQSVLAAITEVLLKDLKETEEAAIPGLVRLKTRTTDATVDRQGVNPFTKQPALIKGRPASRKVKAFPVKALKDAVA